MKRALCLLSCLSLAVCMTACTDDTVGTDDNADMGNGDNAEISDSDTGDTDGPQECGAEWAEKTDPTVDSVMAEFGAPCTEDAECTAILGDGGVCVTNILGVYDLPGGFCSKYCELPDSGTSFLHDAPDCHPDGGVTCVGAKDLFTACIIPCENHDQCGREGYGCRTMPSLASEGDPTFCLMSPVDCCTTDSGECAM